MAFIIVPICYSGTERHKRPSQFFSFSTSHFFFSQNIFYFILCTLCTYNVCALKKYTQLSKNYDSLLWSLLEDEGEKRITTERKIIYKKISLCGLHKNTLFHLHMLYELFNGCKSHKYSLKWNENI